MLISLIAAIDRRGLIGDDSGLPWRLPKGPAAFRTYTWGKPIIMGCKTFELIGKPLPGRFNIVLSQDAAYQPEGCRVARTFAEALGFARVPGERRRRRGDGHRRRRVYAEAIHCWDRLYLTVVDGQFQGSASFPLQELLRQAWRPVCAAEVHPLDEKNPHQHTFPHP